MYVLIKVLGVTELVHFVKWQKPVGGTPGGMVG